MKYVKPVLTILFAIFMIYGGINHFLKPSMYFAFIPDFLPKEAINYATGILEIGLGIGAILPKTRNIATMGILLLMLAFLPLHFWDVFRENPAIGSHQASLIRLPFQFVFIAWAWYISRK